MMASELYFERALLDTYFKKNMMANQLYFEREPYWILILNNYDGQRVIF